MAKLKAKIIYISPSTDCFLCGQPIREYPIVFWQGANDTAIATHLNCGEHLGVGLIRDSAKEVADDQTEKL